MLQNNKDHIVCYHEHDSLLDHKEEEELSEEERKAAWAEYEAEKKVGGGGGDPRTWQHTDESGAVDELDEPVGLAGLFSSHTSPVVPSSSFSFLWDMKVMEAPPHHPIPHTPTDPRVILDSNSP